MSSECIPGLTQSHPCLPRKCKVPNVICAPELTLVFCLLNTWLPKQNTLSFSTVFQHVVSLWEHDLETSLRISHCVGKTWAWKQIGNQQGLVSKVIVCARAKQIIMAPLLCLSPYFILFFFFIIPGCLQPWAKEILVCASSTSTGKRTVTAWYDPACMKIWRTGKGSGGWKTAFTYSVFCLFVFLVWKLGFIDKETNNLLDLKSYLLFSGEHYFILEQRSGWILVHEGPVSAVRGHHL